DAARLHVAERPAQTGPASQPGPRPDAPHSRRSLHVQARRQKSEHGRIRKLTDDLYRLIFTKLLTPLSAVCILSLAIRLGKLMRINRQDAKIAKKQTGRRPPEEMNANTLRPSWRSWRQKFF